MEMKEMGREIITIEYRRDRQRERNKAGFAG